MHSNNRALGAIVCQRGQKFAREQKAKYSERLVKQRQMMHENNDNSNTALVCEGQNLKDTSRQPCIK